MKPERIQFAPTWGVPEPPLGETCGEAGEIGDWAVDPTANAISRHFPQPSFSDSAAFLTKAAAEVEKHGVTPFAWVDASGVTLRLGNPPTSGVTEADRKLAEALSAIS